MAKTSMSITARRGAQMQAGMPRTAMQATGSAPRAVQDELINAATLTHPRYAQWVDDWIALGHIYEGDGPYMTGEALIPHPRELTYATSVDGMVNFDVVTGTTRKYKQRQRVAHYENMASVIVDTLVDHQFSKGITRSIKERGVLGHHPIERFWEDVDGEGTSMSDWMEQAQTLAHVYGHLFVVMDRLERVERAAEGKLPRVRTRAQMSRPILRLYVPPDVPDWLAPSGFLRAVKLREAGERKSLLDITSAADPEASMLVLTPTQWQRLDTRGRIVAAGDHEFGRLPVLVFRAHRRARIPVIGRSTLRDPRLYQTHYNLISEAREIIRNQTFSVLNIQLGNGETVEQARGKLGQHMGTDSILYSTNAAAFIAPPDGPLQAVVNQIHALETKIFRLVGLPYEQDNRQGVSEGTARLKTKDINSLLQACANRGERLEYQIDELWASSEYGPGRALSSLDEADLTVRYPSEFYVEQLAEVVADATATIAVGVGPSATAAIKKRVVHVALRDASYEQLAEIEREIDERAEYDAEEAELIAMAARRAGRPGLSVAADGSGGDPSDPHADDPSASKGSDPANDPASGGRSTDPRATPPRPSGGTRKTDPPRRGNARTIEDLRMRHKPIRG